MRKGKKLLTIALVSTMIAGNVIPATAATSVVQTQVTDSSVSVMVSAQWFKNQLTDKELVFYNALEKMYQNGIFKTGTGSMNLVNGDFEGNKLTADDIKAYIEGDASLGDAFEAGRNAFLYDHAELFYVDFAKVTLRVGTSQNGNYNAELGSGSNSSYFVSGFNSKEEVEAAIAKTNDAVKGIADKASQKATLTEQLKAAHDAIVERVEYTSDGDFVNGVYGALVNGTALCEGYARAYKAVLDEMEIPSVLVMGKAQNSQGGIEDHMWCAVQVDGVWFAVDPTWDDPIGGSLRYDYFLKGSTEFSVNHTEVGNFSISGKEFTYPALFDMDYEKIAGQTDKTDGLVIDAVDKVDSRGSNYTEYTYSYNGMGIKEMSKLATPLHMAMRLSPDGNTWFGWSDMEMYYGKESSQANLWYNGYVQFAVTEKAMDGIVSYNTDLSQEGNHIALSEAYRITESLGNSNYVAPPYAIEGTPSLTSVIAPEDQTITITYDENLKPDGNPISVTVIGNDTKHLDYNVGDGNVSWENGSEDVKVGNIEWTRETCKVTFQFNPDKTYNSQYQTYRFQINGLVGENSEKAPKSVGYVTYFSPSGSCQNMHAVANIDNTVEQSFDPSNYVYNSSDWNSNGLGILLVATKEDGTTSLSDMSLSCKLSNERVRNGEIRVTIGVGYPDGFDPRYDGDVTFKAYRFVQNADGSSQAVELPCSQTDLGLRIVQERF